MSKKFNLKKQKELDKLYAQMCNGEITKEEYEKREEEIREDIAKRNKIEKTVLRIALGLGTVLSLGGFHHLGENIANKRASGYEKMLDAKNDELAEKVGEYVDMLDAKEGELVDLSNEFNEYKKNEKDKIQEYKLYANDQEKKEYEESIMKSLEEGNYTNDAKQLAKMVVSNDNVYAYVDKNADGEHIAKVFIPVYNAAIENEKACKDFAKDVCEEAGISKNQTEHTIFVIVEIPDEALEKATSIIKLLAPNNDVNSLFGMILGDDGALNLIVDANTAKRSPKEVCKGFDDDLAVAVSDESSEGSIGETPRYAGIKYKINTEKVSKTPEKTPKKEYEKKEDEKETNLPPVTPPPAPSIETEIVDPANPGNQGTGTDINNIPDTNPSASELVDPANPGNQGTGTDINNIPDTNPSDQIEAIAGTIAEIEMYQEQKEKVDMENSGKVSETGEGFEGNGWDF